jgi:putative endonuclease
MFYVYVLQSKKDWSLYTGLTDNLRKRLIKHNSGKVFSTKHHMPLQWIYIEICRNREDAKKRERYLKTGPGKRYLKYRLRHYFKQSNQ